MALLTAVRNADILGGPDGRLPRAPVADRFPGIPGNRSGVATCPAGPAASLPLTLLGSTVVDSSIEINSYPSNNRKCSPQ